MLRFAITVVVLSFLFCKHEPINSSDNNNNPPNPDDPIVSSPTCSPDTVYFQNDILPILISNCTESGCHNSIDKEDGVVTDSYATLIQTVDDVNSTDWDKNELLEVLVESDPDDRMPYGQPPLTAEQINKIKKWVDQGARNNQCVEDNSNCVTMGLTYNNAIKNLIETRCQGCHSGNAPQGNLNLSTYQGVKTVALNGKLYNSITRSNDWMPKGGAKLSNCNVQKIEAWVNAGAPE